MSFHKQSQAFFAATLVLRVAYMMFAYFTLTFVAQYESLLRSIWGKYAWPLFWASSLSRGTVLDIVIAGSAVACFYALFRPGHRLARVLVAYFFLAQLTVLFAGWDIKHTRHAFLWAYIVLALAPTWRDQDPRRSVRQRVLQNFFFVQVTLGFFYFLAGFTKVIAAVIQLTRGEYSFFHLSGMSRLMADRLLDISSTTAFGPFLVEHQWIAFFGIWVTILDEMLGLWVIFRPKLHRAWGLSIIVFHFLVVFSFSPNFVDNVRLFFLFFMLSPFAIAGVGEQGWERPTWNYLGRLCGKVGR